jgi:hypothetical protein
MTAIDWGKERQLRKVYQAMADGELERIAADLATLTDAARDALRGEMISRGMRRLVDLGPAAEDERKIEQERERLEPMVIRRYRDLPEATIGKSILDSAGITSFLADFNVIRLDWFISNLLGGVKLLVRKKDADLATALLEQETPDQFYVEGLKQYEQPRCPQCSSTDISLDGLHKPASYASLLIKVPIPIIDHGWRCHSCGHNWEEEPGPEPSAQ